MYVIRVVSAVAVQHARRGQYITKLRKPKICICHCLLGSNHPGLSSQSMETIMKHMAEDPAPNLTYGLRNLEGIARRHNHEIRLLTAGFSHSLLLKDLLKYNENKPSKIHPSLKATPLVEAHHARRDRSLIDPDARGPA